MILIIKYVRFVIKNVESDTKYCFLLILFQISFTQNPDYANFANGIVFSEKIFGVCIILWHFRKKKNFLSNNVINQYYRSGFKYSEIF